MLSWALPASACPGGRPDPGLCPGMLCSSACAVGFPLPATQLPPWHCRSSPSELLPVLPCTLQPLGSSAHSPGAQVSVSVPGSPRASPPSWVLLQLPASPFPPGKVGAAPAPPGRGSPVLGTLAPASARLLAGPLPLGGLCFFISFSPSSYLDRSANSSHCCIPAGLSLNLRPNS